MLVDLDLYGVPWLLTAVFDVDYAGVVAIDDNQVWPAGEGG